MKTATKEQLRELKRLASRASSLVKKQYPDMADCHNASGALQEVLRERGYEDARVLGCSVITGNSLKLHNRCGDFKINDDPAHSVVVVSGHLIDPTLGQFRVHGIKLPDYLILSPKIVAPMLEQNRKWMSSNGALALHRVKNGEYDFAIAYIPTDPDSFHCGGN